MLRSEQASNSVVVLCLRVYAAACTGILFGANFLAAAYARL